MGTKSVSVANSSIAAGLATVFCLSLALLAVNHLGMNYQGVSYATGLLKLLPLYSLFLFLAPTLKKDHARLGIFFHMQAYYFFVVFVLALFMSAIQYTPFAPIDEHLLLMEQWLGIDLPQLMAWGNASAARYVVLSTAYQFLAFEVALLPIILGLLQAEQHFQQYCLAILFSALVGGLLYYFWPTIAPAGVMSSEYFSSMQMNTALKFTQIRSYQPVAHSGGGMIAMPSFHTIWAILATASLRSSKVIFLLLLVVNCLVIAATVLLGWHYLVDSIAGMVIAGVAVFLTAGRTIAWQKQYRKRHGQAQDHVVQI